MNIIKKIIVFIFIQFSNEKILRKLIKESNIPNNMKKYLTDEKGLCVYMIFNDYLFGEIESKFNPNFNEEDFFKVDKIVEKLESHELFE